MAGIKVITEDITKEVGLLEDVSPEFVSLVRHGANRQPFRLIKDEQPEGGDLMKGSLAIQSILVPKGTTLQKMSELDGFQCLNEAKSELTEEFTGYTKMVQESYEKFEPSSMQMIKAGNGFIVLGRVKSDVDSKSMLTLGVEQVKKISSMPVSPMNAIIGDSTAAAQAALAVSFRDMFDREMWSMNDIIYGALNQSSTEANKRKQIIVNAIDAFKSFIVIGLDAIGGAAVKLEKPQSKNQSTKEGGTDEMAELFTTKDEFEKAVGDIVSTALIAYDTKKAEDAAKAETDAAAATAAAAAEGKTPTTEKTEKTDEGATKLKTDIDALTATVGDLVKKFEDFGNQLAGDPAAGTGTEGDGTATPAAPATKKSVFSGMLSKV